MSALDVLFVVLAVMVLGAAALAVTGRHLVHSALWLVVALVGVAAVYLVLGAEVVAMVQLLVYVGAVVVMVLFALMMTRSPLGARDDLTLRGGQHVAAVAAGVSVTALLGGVLAWALGGVVASPSLEAGSPEAVGAALFTGWLLPFELLSVLLLAALVGAIAVSATQRAGAAGGTGRTGGTGGTGRTGGTGGAAAGGGGR